MKRGSSFEILLILPAEKQHFVHSLNTLCTLQRCDERLGVCTSQLFLTGLQQQPESSDPGCEQQHWFQK